MGGESTVEADSMRNRSTATCGQCPDAWFNEREGHDDGSMF